MSSDVPGAPGAPDAPDGISDERRREGLAFWVRGCVRAHDITNNMRFQARVQAMVDAKKAEDMTKEKALAEERAREVARAQQVGLFWNAPSAGLHAPSQAEEALADAARDARRALKGKGKVGTSGNTPVGLQFMTRAFAG